jgi:hypothetical protein
MQAQPFLRPALENNRDYIEKRLGRAVREAVQAVS